MSRVGQSERRLVAVEWRSSLRAGLSGAIFLRLSTLPGGVSVSERARLSSGWFTCARKKEGRDGGWRVRVTRGSRWRFDVSDLVGQTLGAYRIESRLGV